MTRAAIDTGTTLVGGPAEAIARLYSTIPGSSPGTGQLAGYYLYRKSASHTTPHSKLHLIHSLACATKVSISVTFGENGTAWPISPADFKLVQLSDDTCVGAFFEMQQSPYASAPTWIMGDTFLVRRWARFTARSH